MSQPVMRARRTYVTAFQALTSAFSRLTDSSTPLLPFIPKPIKFLFLLLVLFNSPSFPFTWHFRVFATPIKAYFDVWTKGRRKYLEDREKLVMKGGGIRMKARTARLAWADDCDFNLHLSNSAYAKNLDAARMTWCTDVLAPFFTPGSHMAMGASHYVFVKEIPMGSAYVMESRAGGWGEKWMYLITEFIVYPKNFTTSKSSSDHKNKLVKPDPLPAGPAIPTISAPPSDSISSTPPVSGLSSPVPLDEIKRSATLRSRAARADGGIVTCLAVSEYCYKLGRQTIPPRIAMHYGCVSPLPERREHAKNLILKTKDRGAAWLKGGWRDEVNASELGREIGIVEVDGGAAQSEDGGSWIAKGREGMERVVEGLAVF